MNLLSIPRQLAAGYLIPKARLSTFLPSVVAALSEELHRLRHNEFRFSDAAFLYFQF